jgi:hypothetical protein
MTKTYNTSPRIYEKPVAWLLGKQLLGGLKGILLYAAYGEKLDPRDWMSGEEFSFANESTENQEEFWFDYLSDAGDGTKAMYSIAYLAMTSLWTKLSPVTTNLPANESDRRVGTTSDGQTLQLPRGQFLFIGGDTAYHVAEYMTLVNRIQRPFSYAYLDLLSRKLISEDEPRRPLFGIPGNHDYYDQVDGFRRQFRKPVRPEGPLPPKPSGGAYAQLTVAGFKRVQEASYVALRLPFGWRLWGLDTEPGVIDRRQRKFFRTFRGADENFSPPEKLILGTCSPSTVFGRIADEDDPKVAKSLKSLGLSLPFLPDKDANGNPNFNQSGDEKLEKGQCRLDLSGDVHHYARYWGPKPQVASVTRELSSAPVASAASYASVVSGSGGAFHHPSTTYDNEVCEQVLYPSEGISRAVAASRLFKFWNVMTGGYVWLAGFILAFTIYFGVTVPQSSRQFISNLGVLNRLELTEWEPIGPAIIQPGNSQPCDRVRPYPLWTTLGLVTGEWQPPAGCTAEKPTYFFPTMSSWPLDLIIGQLFIFLSLVVIILTFVLSVFTIRIFNDASPYAKGNNPDRKLVPIIIGTTILVIVGLLTVEPYRHHIAPFVSSLIVLFSIFAAMTAIILNVRYSEYLFKKSFVPPAQTGKAAALARKVDNYLPWVLWLVAISITACGLWFFGQNNLPAYLVSDIVFIVVLIAGVIGIMLLPFKVAADLLYTKPKLVQVFGKSIIGLWHLALQLLVPFVLIKRGNYITWAVAAILLVLPIGLARTRLKKNSAVGLSLLWFVYGGVLLALPWLTSWGLSLVGLSSAPVFSHTTGWLRLMPCLVAGGAGAIICCLWTGWYFAVCFIFNGHNNEVGGAARIEEFKQFIRFRLTPNGLTGYVIAVDDVSMIGEADATGRIKDGSDLHPKLIDVFHLTPK